MPALYLLYQHRGGVYKQSKLYIKAWPNLSAPAKNIVPTPMRDGNIVAIASSLTKFNCMHNTSTHSSDLPPRARIGVVLLAAGSASRIGHRPKCLLELDGEPLIQRQLRAILSCNLNEVVVVLGHYAEHIKPIVTNFPVTLVHNSAPDAGQNSSLHCGLNALSHPLDAVLVVLADQPLLDTQDIGDLVHAFQHRRQMTEVVVPTVTDLPGNPVIFSAEVRNAILASDMSFGCKQWQAGHPDRVYRWSTANEHYRLDIDTLEDIELFRAQTGLNLRWPSPQNPT